MHGGAWQGSKGEGSQVLTLLLGGFIPLQQRQWILGVQGMAIEINSPRSYAQKEDYGDEEMGWRSGSVSLLFFQRHGTHVSHNYSFNSEGGLEREPHQ